MTELRDASKKRDDDTRRLGDDVRGLQDMIPKAMKTQEKSQDDRLRDLSQELKSLKTLLTNRIRGSAPSPAPRPSQNTSAVNGNNASNTPAPNGTAPDSGTKTAADSTPEPQQDASNPLARFSAGKGGIPSWQMAASKLQANGAGQTSESGTAVDAGSGSA